MVAVRDIAHTDILKNIVDSLIKGHTYHRMREILDGMVKFIV